MFESMTFPFRSWKAFSDWTPADSKEWEVTLLLGNLSRGFVFPAGLALIAESELFGEKRLGNVPPSP
jgi:hypothetical protein